ncbi:hypothetical protein BRAS3843_2630021 [Bradyrhizobium sp. STM 3843]|nr:hypothetical protein BRAS3843_2630021 [Bradyrhizobium sp. STM 3843]
MRPVSLAAAADTWLDREVPAKASVGWTAVRATAATVASTVARLPLETSPLFVIILRSSVPIDLNRPTRQMEAGFPDRNPTFRRKSPQVVLMDRSASIRHNALPSALLLDAP